MKSVSCLCFNGLGGYLLLLHVNDVGTFFSLFDDNSRIFDVSVKPNEGGEFF